MRLRLLHLKRTTKRIIWSSVALLVILVLSSSRAPSTVEAIQARGVLRMVTQPGPNTYFEDAKGPNGLEYVLARNFAQSLGVTLQVTTMDNLNALFIAIGGPRADFAAAGLTVTPERRQRVRFSDPYYQVSQQLIYQLGEKRPESLRDTYGKTLLVIADSSHAENLRQLRHEFPGLHWREERTEMIELMEQVNNGDIDFAVVDSSAYRVNRHLYPRVRVAFDLSEPEDIAWTFPRYGDDSLIRAANQFFKDYRDSGRLEKLLARFAGQEDGLNFASSQLFLNRVATRLPEYEAMFRSVAEEYEMDWRLLSAIAYQESHWNPLAISPTGVRGLMMLTRQTAREMGVTNRLDPEQSLRGGARYFLKTKARIPADILEPDRTYLALAAYNVGMGHLEDARILTQRAGKNPDLWEHVRDHLPLLQKKKYYASVRHGYARGNEPVRYVRNIRKFDRILRLHDIERNRRAEQDPIDLPSSSKLDLDSLLSL